MSVREDALTALLVAVRGVLPSGTVLRSTGTPEAIPAGASLVTVHEGACEAAEPILSPLSYEIIWTAPLTVDADTSASRGLAADAIAGVLISNPTLSGAVDWAEMGMPEGEVVSSPSMDGQQPPIFSITLPIRLHYVATSPAG